MHNNTFTALETYTTNNQRNVNPMYKAIVTLPPDESFISSYVIAYCSGKCVTWIEAGRCEGRLWMVVYCNSTMCMVYMWVNAIVCSIVGWEKWCNCYWDFIVQWFKNCIYVVYGRVIITAATFFMTFGYIESGKMQAEIPNSTKSSFLGKTEKWRADWKRRSRDKWGWRKGGCEHGIDKWHLNAAWRKTKVKLWYFFWLLFGRFDWRKWLWYATHKCKTIVKSEFIEWLFELGFVCQNWQYHKQYKVVPMEL